MLLLPFVPRCRKLVSGCSVLLDDVLADPCVCSVQEELDAVKAKLVVAETAREAAKGSDETEYQEQRQEVIRLSSSVDALRNQIAAEKPAGKVPTNSYQTPPHHCS